MEAYIQQWYDVIEKMKNTNTYKLVWAKSILDLLIKTETKVITFSDISETILKYYWNQIYFFNLKQGPRNQEPTLFKLVGLAIKRYQELTQSKQPVWFNLALPVLQQDQAFYRELIQSMSQTLDQDVSWRFLNIEDEVINLYHIHKKKTASLNEVVFSDTHITDLKEHGPLLMQFLYFKWTQLLEKFNHAPRIANKIAGSEVQAIKRKSLKVYRDILLILHENQAIKDFYTDETIDISDISIDHFIPWSFIYSDDIWNLVITSKSNNSKKSNKLSDKQYLTKLKEQNLALVSKIKDLNLKETLQDAINHSYLDKFYFDYKT
jgi:5-methylcytosine-specific restriction endonuclease McrA